MAGKIDIMKTGMTMMVPREAIKDLRFGTGRVIPQKFTPPSSTDTPDDLFPLGIGHKAMPPVRRFIRRTDPSQALIYTDGACLDNGNEGSRGGCAFVFHPPMETRAGSASMALEERGPTGEKYPHTSNRAEIRAVIAALRYRVWTGEGFRSLVIATDSEYVVDGITVWIHNWLSRGWRTSNGQPVKNKDLWLVLLGEVERWSDAGLKVMFWHIPRKFNTRADYLAKEEAASKSYEEDFIELSGQLV